MALKSHCNTNVNLNTFSPFNPEHIYVDMSGRPEHPLRKRAVYLMRHGLATVGEIASVGDVPRNTVNTWRRRYGRINTKARRTKRVHYLLFPPGMGK